MNMDDSAMDSQSRDGGVGRSSQKTNTCKKCQENFKDFHLHRLMPQSDQHEASIVYHKCPVCAYLCSTIRLLKKHISCTHINHQVYTCSTCNTSYDRECALQEHTNQCCHVNKVMGDICGQLCREKYPFDSPMKTRIIGKCLPLKLVKQPTDHIDINVNEEVNCKYCQNIFQNSKLLKCHMRSAHYRKSQICSQCGKMFRDTYNLHVHMATHSDQKSYICEHCGEAYKMKVSLKDHLARKHKIGKQLARKRKKHICPVCKHAFIKKTAFIRHMYTHNESMTKPLLCDQCNAKFAIVGDLNRHLKRHANLKRYNCQLCHKQYALCEDLTKHVQRCHTGKSNAK